MPFSPICAGCGKDIDDMNSVQVCEDCASKIEVAETCAMCGGDLKWPDGKVHAKVCLPCFGKLAQASPVR